MKKIIDIFDNEWDLVDECLGCKIANKNVTAPFGVLFETDNFVVVQDIETPIPGFMVINCKKHIRSILDLSEEEYIELMNLSYEVRKAMGELGDIEDVSIIQKELAPHFHLWLFPRYKWMINNSKLGLGYGKLSDYTKIIEYSRKNHKSKQNIAEIEEYCRIIKENLENA